MCCYVCIHILMVLYCASIGYILVLPTTEAKLCTKKVKISHPNVKKIPMTKKIPAKCSNWDRAWTWITRMDCGTKYAIEYVDFTTHLKEHYKIEYGCCPGDKDCNEAKARKQGSEETDDRFLTIAFGSATAALTILIIIIIITICRKQLHRRGFCSGRSQYESTQGQNPSDFCHRDYPCQNEYICDDLKNGESEYEEIRDIPPGGLTDISEMKSQKNTFDEIKEGNNLQPYTDEKGHHSVGADAHVHKSPEPSAPLLETFSETYAESGLLTRACESPNKESANMMCSEDIDYIAIPKPDLSHSKHGNQLGHSDIELSGMQKDTNSIPEYNKSAKLSFYCPVKETKDIVSLNTDQIESNHENASLYNVNHSPVLEKDYSYEQLDTNLAHVQAQPYESLTKEYSPLE